MGAVEIRQVAVSSHAPTTSGRTGALIETVRTVPAMDPWLSEET
jgi:hypothetical protein